MKYIAVLILGFLITSCSITTNNNNYYSLGIDPEQACILKDHYLKNNKEIPESVESALEESNADCD